MKIKQLENYNVHKVMKELTEGKFSIPRFQRDFVWPSQKIISLGKSLIKNFPIGVLTTWRADEGMFEGRNEIIERMAGGRRNSDSMLVIDGQQRMTSIAILYYAELISKNIQLGYYSEQLSKTINQTYKNILFIDGKFVDRTDYIEMLKEEGCSQVEANTRATLQQVDNPIINREVQDVIGEYRIFIHVISDANIKAIIDVFRAMNTQTKPLTHIDLMNGSMFNVSEDKFDLLDFIKKSNENWKNFGKISGELFVILMKIYSDIAHSVTNIKYKSDDLVRWANDESKARYFIDNKHIFIKKVISTISTIERKLNIYTIKNLPKDVYFISVFTLICKLELGDQDPRLDGILRSVIHHITKRLVFGDYSSSPNAKALDDINKVIIPLCYNQTPDYENEFEYRDESVLQKFEILTESISYKKKTSALFKFSLAVLAAERPYNLFDDNFVQVSPSESTKVDIDVHHFFPKKSNLVGEYHISEDRINRLGNLVLIGSEENRKKISDQDVNIYLEKAKNDNPRDFNDVMKSHHIPYDTLLEVIDQYEKQEDDDSVTLNSLLDKFWSEREKVIFEKIKSKFLGL